MANKNLASPVTRPDLDVAHCAEMIWRPESKYLEMKICLMNSSEGKPSKIVRHVVAEEDYDSMMDAMGDDQKDLKTQLEDALWADAEDKGAISLA